MIAAEEHVGRQIILVILKLKKKKLNLQVHTSISSGQGGRTDSHHLLHKGVTLSIKTPVIFTISAKAKKRLKLHKYAKRQNSSQITGKNAFAQNRLKF